MPANPLNASKFLLNSDYELDKLITIGTVEATVPGSTVGGSASRSHTFPFSPLMWGSYALDSSYATLYSINSGPFTTNPATHAPYEQNLRMRSDSDEIIFLFDNYGASPVTFYVRYFGFAPAGDDTDYTGGTVPMVDNFMFNTDLNYTKLYLSGTITQSAGSGGTQTVNHGLGIYPQVLTWKDDAGLLIPLTFHDAGDLQSEDVSVHVTDQDLVFTFSGLEPGLTIHYRLYIDE